MVVVWLYHNNENGKTYVDLRCILEAMLIGPGDRLDKGII